MRDDSVKLTSPICVGLPSRVQLNPVPAWFSVTDAKPSELLENKQKCPIFTLQLCDAFDLKTTPMADQDR